MKYTITINATHGANIDFHTCFDPWRLISYNDRLFLMFFKNPPSCLVRPIVNGMYAVGYGTHINKCLEVFLDKFTTICNIDWIT